MSSEFPYWPGLESCGLRYRGPGPEAGPLPSCFAFAISAPMTLGGGPIALPAELLSAQKVRVFSIDLPHHSDGVDPKDALHLWAKDFIHGINPFISWLDCLEVAIEQLAEEGFLGPVSFYGISRGALIAAWAAVHLKWPAGIHLHKLCAWSPLVRLGRGSDFQEIAHLPVIQNMDCCLWVDRMVDIPLKVWIGNLDRRVGVLPSFEWVEQLALAQNAARHRICHSELIICPSIGHLGHGTSPESFREGVEWLLQ